jgi:hypothetical protein
MLDDTFALYSGCIMDLHEERLVDKRVRVHLDTADIADYFEYQASEHSAKEPPGSVADSKADLSNQHEPEHSCIERIACKTREVQIMCLEKRASFQRAERVWNDGFGNETHDEGLFCLDFGSVWIVRVVV